MLLTNRRLTLLFLCLAGLEAAWATPFWLLIYPNGPRPWAAFGLLLAGLLLWMLALELLSRTKIGSPLYELLVLGLAVVTSLLTVRIVLYRGLGLLDFRWLAAMMRDSSRNAGIFPPAVALIAVNLFLWQRATAATGRDLSFFNVGVSFRAGMLLLFLGAGLLAYLRGQSLFSFLWVYFALGLTAVALARVEEKAAEAQSAGVVLPPPRLMQLLLAVGLTIGGAWLLALIYSPAEITRFLHLFDPLWRLLGPIVYAALLVLGRLLDPFLMWLEARLTALLRDTTLPVPDLSTATAQQQPSPLSKLPLWVPSLLGNLALAAGILLAALIIVGLLLLYLERVRKASARREAEEEGLEQVTFRGGILGRGAQALRNAAKLIRRLGLGTRLLAAVSVQNIYANVCRLARERGYPRRPAQPPDDYLPMLAQAFAGLDEPLARITAAYMRVHYGDHPVTLAALAQLREDYQLVRISDTGTG